MKKLKMPIAFAAIAIAAFAIAGCASSNGTESPADTPPTDTVGEGQESTTTVPDHNEHSPELDDMVDEAVADLADRLSVSADDVTVALVQSVTWSDGSMGCPEQGMFYTQALVDGVRIELTVDGTSYWYHQGGTNPARLCADPGEPLEVTS